jgi:CDP-glycerol glycerophosphotransferase (TagB/SpsB family)
MDSKLYSKSDYSFVVLGFVEADIMLATTPNISTPGYPLKRSPNVKELVHVFHAFAGIAHYRKGSLDNYDTVIMVGEHEAKPIRKLEEIRKSRQKKLIALGLPYIDTLYRKVREQPEKLRDTASEEKELTNVLVGSSWGSKGLLTEYGVSFIKNIAEEGYLVIVRPHPHSNVFEEDFIRHCQDETKDYSNVTWDFEPDGSLSMHKSHILISDTSSIRFDYAFLYSKPVITLQIPRSKQDDFEVSCFEEPVWIEEAESRIGKVVNKETIENLPRIIKETISAFDGKLLEKFRSETVSNFGSCAGPIVNYLAQHESGQKGQKA